MRWPVLLVPVLVLLLGAAAVALSEASPSRTAASGAPLQAALPAWSDGNAELSGYRLVRSRYGELRRGTVVSIVVKEDLSDAHRVKVERGQNPADDTFGVLKLNLVTDFQTGVYDYNLMTSTFVRTEPFDGLPVGGATKVSFSSQEWCGHAWHQVLFDGRRARETRHSYFAGEADAMGLLDDHADGLVEDAVLLWARGLAAPFLSEGEERRVDFLPSLSSARLDHEKLAWTSAMLSRRARAEPVTVPAGTFEVDVAEVRPEGRAALRVFVERAAPRRVIAWEDDAGTRAELLGSDRMPYWRLHDEGHEQALARIGLPIPEGRVAPASPEAAGAGSDMQPGANAR